MLVTGDGEKRKALTSDVIYMSDSLMPIGKGIESTVKRYVKNVNPLFVSSEYVQSHDLDGKELLSAINIWNQYLSSLGVLTKIQDLVINSVLPNLSETEEEDILSLLGEYYDDIHKEDEWNKHLHELKKLLVRSGDEFIPISESVYIESTASEPFPSIAIINQMNPHTHV